jgi:hypothetical protein
MESYQVVAAVLSSIQKLGPAMRSIQKLGTQLRGFATESQSFFFYDPLAANFRVPNAWEVMLSKCFGAGRARCGLVSSCVSCRPAGQRPVASAAVRTCSCCSFWGGAFADGLSAQPLSPQAGSARTRTDHTAQPTTHHPTCVCVCVATATATAFGISPAPRPPPPVTSAPLPPEGVQLCLRRLLRGASERALGACLAAPSTELLLRFRSFLGMAFSPCCFWRGSCLRTGWSWTYCILSARRWRRWGESFLIKLTRFAC